MNRVLSSFTLAAALACGAVACKSKAEPPPTGKVTMARGTVVDGVRRIEIAAGLEGYVPAKIPGKPGEKLVLVFTRTVEGDCLSELKTPDGTVVPLPMNAPVEVAVTVPAQGELTFACGMNMFTGVIVAES